jgi:hypothetical protein
MARKERKYHYIYKTTNIITGRYYYGMHSTDNLNDCYIGSGKRLWYSINKYGKENHNVEILEFYDSRKLLKKREKNLINEDLLKDPMCMNLVVGGSGGIPINVDLQLFHKMGGKKGGNIHAERLKNDIEYAKQHRENWNNMMKNARLTKKCYRDWTGKKHTDEEKRKIGAKNSIKQKGENNSQYGTCWITNEIENKKIRKEDDIPNGWRLGRKLKMNE